MTLPLLLRVFFVSLLLDVGAVAQAMPTLSNPVAAVGANGAAVLSATVATNGATTNVTFNYGLTTNYDQTGSVSVANVVVAQTPTLSLTGLIGGRTYNFQVAATNSAGAATPTGNQLFDIPAYAGRPTTGTATTVAGTATLRGTVTANGTKGTVRFEIGPPNGVANTYGTNVPATPADPGENGVGVAIQGTIPGLIRNATYHFRLVFVDEATSTPVNGSDAQFVTNNAPVANTDTVNAPGSGPTTINPLANDRDRDGDVLTVDDIETQPEFGTATVVGNTIVYTPTPGSVEGFDSFTYSIVDAFGMTATGTINIRSIRGAFAGTHGGFIKRINGKEVGYFSVTATANGSFTGIALIDGKRFVVSGTITPDGVYRGFAVQGASSIPVFLFTDQGDSNSTVTALFGNGQWSSELNISPDERATRGDVRGRYTVGLGSGGTTTTTDVDSLPDGTGWAAIRVRDDGTAALKGRLPDGRSFATRGTVDIIDGAATLSFYDDPEDTRVVGSLTLGDTVGGTVRTDRHSSGEGSYPRGFDISPTVSGARYIEPADGKRVLDTTGSKGQELSIAFSGGGLGNSISRQLFLDDRDKVTVLDPNGEDLKLRIDRKSGRFQAKVTIDDSGKRLKATGVLIQSGESGSGGRGVGIFEVSGRAGAVTISGGGTGSGTTPTPTPTPTPDPVVVVP